MQESRDIKQVSVKLYMDNDVCLVPIYYKLTSTRALAQLAYYELIGYQIKSDDVLRVIVGKTCSPRLSVFDDEQDSTKMHQRLDRFMIAKPADFSEVMDYSFNEEKNKEISCIQTEWLKLMAESLNVHMQDVGSVVDQFVTYFMTRGLFDCNSKSLKSTATLHIFCVLLDLLTEAPGVCRKLIDASTKWLPDDFEDKDGAVNNEIKMGIVLSLILDRSKGSTGVLKSLLLTQNRSFLQGHPEFYLISADLMDPQLFGFDVEEYIHKRAIFYYKGMDYEATKHICKSRLSGMFSVLNNSKLVIFINFLETNNMLTNIASMIAESDLIKWSGLELVSFLDGFYCNGRRDLTDHKKMTEQNYWRELAKYHIDLSQQQTGIMDKLKYLTKLARDAVIIDKCKLLEMSLEQRYAGRYTKDKFDDISRRLNTKLRESRITERLIECNSVLMQLIDGMSQESKALRVDLASTKILEVLKSIQVMLHIEAIYDRPTSSSLGYLGRAIYESSKNDDCWKLLYYSLALRCDNVADFEFNKKTLLFIADRKRLYLSKACDLVQNFIDNIGIDGYTESKLIELVKLNIKKILKDAVVTIVSDEAFTYFTFINAGNLIAPSLVKILDHCLDVYHAKKDASQKAYDVPLLDIKLKQWFPQESGFKKSFLDEFNQIRGSSYKIGDGLDRDARVYAVRQEVAKIEEVLYSDSKIAVYKKDMLDVYQLINGLEIFEENGVEVYRGYFITNNQKCTVFKVPYQKSTSLEDLKEITIFLKLFHPKILCFYGIFVDANYKTGEIHLGYVAENFGSTLSMLDHKNLISSSGRKKAQMIYDIAYAVYCFHSVGIAFYQLNPDLVTLTNKSTKVIYPFFLNTKKTFSGQYIQQFLTQGKISMNTIFMKPTILENPETVQPIKLKLTEAKFFNEFTHLMQMDLFALSLLCSYICSGEIFEYLHKVKGKDAGTYLNEFNSWSNKHAAGLFDPLEHLSEHIVQVMKSIFLCDPLSLSTFQLFDCLITDSLYEYPPMTLGLAKNNFRDTLSLINGENLGKGVIYPCSVRLVPYDNVCENEAYFKNNLIMVGPYFNMEDSDPFKFDLFTSDTESIRLNIENGEPNAAEIVFKEFQMETVKRNNSVNVTSFRSESWIPSKDEFRRLLNKAYIADGNKDMPDIIQIPFDKAFILIGKADNRSEDIPIADPFGNFLRVKRNEYLVPDFREVFSIEAYSLHNLGKAMLLEKQGNTIKGLLSRISTFSYGDISQTDLNYLDIGYHFDSCLMDNSSVFSVSGGYFEGRTSEGELVTGFYREGTNNSFPITKDLIHESSAYLNSYQYSYKGLMRDFCPEGFGELICSSKHIYRGIFSNGLPHGKGELLLKDTQTSLFQGYFTSGRPYYGVFRFDQSSIEGHMLTTAKEGSKDRIRDSSKTFLEALSAGDLSVYIHGFKHNSLSYELFRSLILCQISEGLKLQYHSRESNYLAKNVKHEGVMIEGQPNGYGYAMIDENMLIGGIWNSADKSITGWCALRIKDVKENKMKVSEVRKGRFNYAMVYDQTQKEPTNLTINGFCYVELDEGYIKAGEIVDQKFIESKSALLKTSEGVIRDGEPNAKNKFSGYVNVRLQDYDGAGKEAWIEEWKEGKLINVLSQGVDLEFDNWDYKSIKGEKGKISSKKYLNIHIDASAKHIHGKIYSIRETNLTQGLVPNLIVKMSDRLIVCNMYDKQTYGYLFQPMPDYKEATEFIKEYSKDASRDEMTLQGSIEAPNMIKKIKSLNSCIFRGLIDIFEPKRGVLRDLDGNIHVGDFKGSQLHGLGFVWYINYKVLVMGDNFKEGVKEGVYMVTDSLEAFQQNVRVDAARKKIAEVEENLLKETLEIKNANLPHVAIAAQDDKDKIQSIKAQHGSLGELTKIPLRKIFMGEYLTNTKHGFGICYYYQESKEVQQHIHFKHGEVQTVFLDQIAASQSSTN